MQGISRRQFLSGAALSAAALATGGVMASAALAETDAQGQVDKLKDLNSTMNGSGSSSASGSSETITAADAPEWDGTWDLEADVIVCGAGGTGLAASCSAAEAGASVITFEVAEVQGGTTALSGGVIQAAGTEWQKKYTDFQDDTPEIHAQCYIRQAEGIADEDLIRTFTNKAPEAVKWLNGIGVEWASVYGNCHVPYCDADSLHADRIHVPEGGGAAGQGNMITDPEFKYASKLGVDFHFSTKVMALIGQSGVDGICGVLACDSDGNWIHAKASKGVVLGLGGMDRDLELDKAWCQQEYWDLTTQTSLISPNAQGDGIRLGIAAGGAMATCGGTIDFDMLTVMGTSDAQVQLPGLYVNGYGKRFVCEDATYAYSYRAIFQQETQLGMPTWFVMDQNMVEQQLAPWGTDPDSAVADGTLLQSDTLEDLADQMGVPADNLVNTFDLWNANITNYGQDLEYARNTQLITLDKPPYYAHKNASCNLGSLGGLKIDTNAQVISRQGDPIPHLFAGGMNSGGWYGLYYPGSGTSLSGGLCWGLIAGASAAAADAWDGAASGSSASASASGSASGSASQAKSGSASASASGSASASASAAGSAAAGSYKDGTYTGTGTGMGGKINVTLEISGGKITVTDISPNNETKGIGGYEAIEDGTFKSQIEAAQSADIEGVSGASVTSAAIKKAVQAALDQAAA